MADAPTLTTPEYIGHQPAGCRQCGRGYRDGSGGWWCCGYGKQQRAQMTKSLIGAATVARAAVLFRRNELLEERARIKSRLFELDGLIASEKARDAEQAIVLSAITGGVRV